MKIVNRDSITSLHSVLVDSQHHDIGTVKTFAAHKDLAEFAQQSRGLAISWVHLSEGQVLAEHRHDEATMILVTEGKGEVLGDPRKPIKDGDAILVPAGCLHGFKGHTGGFWALSIQFSGVALYENPERPRVRFETDCVNGPATRVLASNGNHIERFRRSSLMSLLSSTPIEDADVRCRLLSCLQTWSDAFQVLLHLRAALTGDVDHGRLAASHAAEEMGHNDNLKEQRHSECDVGWDSHLQGSIAWFKYQMVAASDLERTVLMHMVLEASGAVFHQKAAQIFVDMPHFSEHAEDDMLHAECAAALIGRATTAQLLGIELILARGWSMMIALCDRMAEIALSGECEVGAYRPDMPCRGC